jgi:hypothetical protein
MTFFNEESTVEVTEDNTHSGRISKNVEQLSQLVLQVEDVFRNEEKIRERWAHEALRWATRSSSLHNVVRSYQIFRALRPELRQKDFISILHDISKYFEEMLDENVSEEDPNSSTNHEQIKTAVTIEIIDTLTTIVRHMDDQRLILFPQIFWLCAALLNSDIIYIYVHSLQLLEEVLKHLDLTNDCVLSVLLTSKPKDIGFYFQGIQPLVLKGLTNSYSEPFVLDLISKFILFPCDALFDPSDARLVMSIISLLPALCLSIREEEQKHKYRGIAENLAEYCEQKKLRKIAKVFLRFSKGYYDTQEKFLLDLRKPLSDAFFPQHEDAVFCFLTEMLQFGSSRYHKTILALLHSLLLYVDVANSSLGNREWLITTTANMLKGPLWKDATRVLDVAVRSASRGMQEQIQLVYRSMPSSLTRTPDTIKFKKFTSVAGEGTRTCITLIRKILQQMNQRVPPPNNLNTFSSTATTVTENLNTDTDTSNTSSSTFTNVQQQKKKARRQSLLLELFENMNISNVEDFNQKDGEHIIHPTDLENIDISALTNADFTDDTTSESSEFTDQDLTEVTDTDLLTATSGRYRLAMEDNQEDTSLRQFEQKLLRQLKYFKLSTPYAS